MTKSNAKTLPEKLVDSHYQPARLRGRPIEKTIPAPIPDTPENIAKAILGTPPKKNDAWGYLKQPESSD